MDDDPPPVTVGSAAPTAHGVTLVPGDRMRPRTTDTGRSAFDDFYRTHRADAVRWAVALVGDRAVAEELAQDALAAVGTKLRTIDNPAGYLRRTVGNRAAFTGVRPVP
jgi:DNA-directed RNA polymerase specialized sigma24 family protein